MKICTFVFPRDKIHKRRPELLVEMCIDQVDSMPFPEEVKDEIVRCVRTSASQLLDNMRVFFNQNPEQKFVNFRMHLDENKWCTGAREATLSSLSLSDRYSQKPTQPILRPRPSLPSSDGVFALPKKTE